MAEIPGNTPTLLHGGRPLDPQTLAWIVSRLLTDGSVCVLDCAKSTDPAAEAHMLGMGYQFTQPIRSEG